MKVERCLRHRERRVDDLLPGTVFEISRVGDERVLMAIHVPKNVEPPSPESVAVVILDGERAGDLIWVSRSEPVIIHADAFLKIGE